MSTAFVLGNGISRKEINISLLHLHGKIYGCNALYREFTPYKLVATDRAIAEKIQTDGYALKNKFYTRRPMIGLGAVAVPKQYYGYSSGPIATSLAAIDGYQIIYLLGFDMGPVENNRFNNIYAGTEFYKRIDAPPTYTGNWVKQLIKITGDFKETQFYRVCGDTTACIPDLETIPNLKHLAIDTFLDRINNKKDL